jgi:hypothetical protein
MRPIFRVGTTQTYVAEVLDHPRTCDKYMVVDFVRQKPDGTWEIWQRGHTNRPPLVPTEFQIP